MEEVINVGISIKNIILHLLSWNNRSRICGHIKKTITATTDIARDRIKQALVTGLFLFDGVSAVILDRVTGIPELPRHTKNENSDILI